MPDDKIIPFYEAKAKATGTDPDLAAVIEQINQRFGVNISLTDHRLAGFKALFPVLNEAATLTHDISVDTGNPAIEKAFLEGVSAGKAQMTIDVIICILEKDGLINRV
ncbi:hypothetical protein [Reinekea sp.]|jgi:hypothetical protein|uniref:hypothetical protein n=1 Tax=Reinekea sp. TaxID=1970455 RepID=UPI003989C4AC